MRLLVTALLIGMIGLGASYVQKSNHLDRIEQKLDEAQTAIEDNLGSTAREPTPVAIPPMQPGFNP